MIHIGDGIDDYRQHDEGKKQGEQIGNRVEAAGQSNKAQGGRGEDDRDSIPDGFGKHSNQQKRKSTCIRQD